MDKLEEIKKLKQLLDEGIIDENDFQRKKTQILGLSEKEAGKVEIKNENNESKTLDDYEKELLEQSKIQSEELETKLDDDYYQQEKIKARAQLDAQEEIRQKRKKERKVIVDKGISKTKRLLKWIFAGFLWIFGISAICIAKESGIVYIPLGILTIILGCMACPKITDKTQKYQAYTMHKTIIIWIIVIIWCVLCMVGGSEVYTKTNEDNSNKVNTNNETTIKE